MKFLVDANLLCEPTKAKPVDRAVDWFQNHVLECVTDAVVMGEVWQGIGHLAEGKRRSNLETWFDGLRSRVHCLDWSLDVAIVWGDLVNEVRRTGFTVGIKDTMIAATARYDGLTVATRNVVDFQRCGVPVINPFE
jgi:predicted nucleic acid-binding protein